MALAMAGPAILLARAGANVLVVDRDLALAEARRDDCSRRRQCCCCLL